MIFFLKKVTFNIALLLLILVLNSCNNKKEIQNKDMYFKIEYILPDTIKFNDKLSGKIFYSSKFDTVILKNDESRYVFLYLKVTEKISRNFEEFIEEPCDTFVPLTNENKIYTIKSLKYNKIGNQFIDGYIVDELWLNRNSKNNSIKIPIIESKFIHPIYIKE